MKKENKQEITCSITEAYLKGGLISSIICIPFIFTYGLLFKKNLIESIIEFQNNLSYLTITLIIALGVIIHELLHGLTWSISSKKKHFKHQVWYRCKIINTLLSFQSSNKKNTLCNWYNNAFYFLRINSNNYCVIYSKYFIIILGDSVHICCFW